jgi:hypothetical protein
MYLRNLELLLVFPIEVYVKMVRERWKALTYCNIIIFSVAAYG